MSLSRFFRALGSSLQSMPRFHYAVRSGRTTGVYETWDDCKAQVNGFSGARYKKFDTAEEAWDFVTAQQDTNNYYSNSQSGWGGGRSYAQPYSRPYKHEARSQSFPQACMDSEFLNSTGSTYKRKHDWGNETYSYGSHYYKKARSDSTPYASYYTSQTPSSSSMSSSSSSTSLSSSTSTSSSSSSTSSSSSSGSNGRRRAIVYTDGSCESNGRRGARAGVGVYWGDNNPYNVSERLEGRQTNQRAEITAAIRAVQTAKSRNIKDLTLYTDSKYTINSVNEWMKRWKVNGWKTVNKKEVLNKDDLQTLDGLCQEVNVDWKYVPGHANIKGNEAADSLAKAGARMNSHH